MFVKLSQGDFGLVELPNWPDFVQVEIVNNSKEYYVNIAMENVEIKIETTGDKTSNMFAINYGSDKTISSSDTSAERIVRALISMGLIEWLGNGHDASQELSFDKPVYILTPALKAQLAVIEEWWRIEKGGSFKPYRESNEDNLELAKIVVGQSEAVFYSMEEAVAITMMQSFPSPFVVYNVSRDIGKKKQAEFFKVVLDFIKRGIMRMTYEQGRQNLHLTAEFRGHAMSLEDRSSAPVADNQNFEENNPDTKELARIAAGGVSPQRHGTEANIVCYLTSVYPNAKLIESFRGTLPFVQKDLPSFNSTIHDLERRGIIRTKVNAGLFQLTKEFYDLVVKHTSGQYRR